MQINIERGIEQSKAGLGVPAKDAIQNIAGNLGLNLPQQSLGERTKGFLCFFLDFVRQTDVQLDRRIIMAQDTKTERIEARTSSDVRDLIEKAAKLEGRSISDFVISMAVAGARRTIQEFNVISLSARDQQAFAASLLNPKPAPESLKRAKKRHEELIEPA